MDLGTAAIVYGIVSIAAGIAEFAVSRRKSRTLRALVALRAAALWLPYLVLLAFIAACFALGAAISWVRGFVR